MTSTDSTTLTTAMTQSPRARMRSPSIRRNDDGTGLT
jgi:hypothetical protein